MTEFDQQLRDLQQQMRRQGQLQTQLTSLFAQKKSLEERKNELDRIRIREQSEADRLSSGSLSAFLYRLTGKYEEKLDKEQQEAYAAAVKYDMAVQELAAVEEDIRRLEAEKSTLEGCDRHYAQKLEEKTNLIKAQDPVNGAALLKLEEQICYLEGQKKEVQEALSAGNAALRIADNILNSLNNAQGWGTWDIIGGGLISDMAKHGHLDDAQRKVENLQIQLGRFKTELADITIHTEVQAQVDGFLRFADFFFDGLFADWMVLNRIQNSQKQITDTREQIRSVLYKLGQMQTKASSEQERLESERESLVVGVRV